MIRLSNIGHSDSKRKRTGKPAINKTHDDHGQVNNGFDQRTTIKNNISKSGLLLQLHPSSTKDNKKNKKKEPRPALMRETKIVVINRRFKATKVSLGRMHSFN